MGQDFTAYLDDSGHPTNCEFVIVAGLLASQEQWELLIKEWCATLAPFGLDYFHMSDFEAGHSDYSHITHSDKVAVPRRLANVIRTRVRHSYCYVVPMKDYRGVNSEWAVQECMGTPYALAGGNVLKEISKWHEHHKHQCDNLLVVLDRGSYHKGDLMGCMARDNLPITAESFGNKRKLVPLQAADAFAWEFFHGFKTKALVVADASGSNAFRPSLDILLEIPREDGIFTCQDLEDECRERHVVKRADLEPGQRILFTSAPRSPRLRIPI